jgi:hypothetical protein
MATTEQAPEKQLQIPGFEGHTIDTVKVAFSGTVELNKHDPDVVELFRRMKLGKRVDLAISGVVAGHSFAHRVSDEDGVEVTSQRKLSVDTIEVGA